MNSSLTDHQRMLLSMLKDLDAVCAKHHIKYMLFAGTALGAVRHRGFIPWDDDLDLVMLREEYERFLTVAEQELDRETYYLQKEYSEHWPMQFSKLRRNGTTCMEKIHPRDPLMHQGVYLDIFPCDNLADRPLTRAFQFLASKIVIAKALYARGYETRSFGKKLFLQLCRLIPCKGLRRFCLRRGDGGSAMVHTFFGCGSKYGKNVFPRSWMEETVLLPFEDGEFPVSAHVDELLTRLYGDYWTIPLPEERLCKQHVAILDLHQPYWLYLDQQKRMRYTTLTRSIR